MRGDYLQTQSGAMHPASIFNTPIQTVFQANKMNVTEQELHNLRIFYQTHYMQKFLLKSPNHLKDIIIPTQLPNGERTHFMLDIMPAQKHYWFEYAKIYVNDILQTDAIIIPETLGLIFPVPPLLNNIITVHLDADYIVMFDYAYGLKAIWDVRTKTHKVDFQLII